MNKKEIYGKLLSVIENYFGIDNAKIFDTLVRYHKKLNLKAPRTLSDKVSYIELHAQSPLASMCTDKFEVRKYVESKGWKEILIPIYGDVYEKFEEINFDLLPKSFVIKATHGCKMNYVVKDKTFLNMKECGIKIQQWMATTYGTYSVEPHYLDIPHRFYIEKYLDNIDQLIDYKFHCLNGVPQFVLACSNRVVDKDNSMKVTLDLFDMEWNNIPEIKYEEKSGKGHVKKPKRFKEMIEIAKDLSKDFLFVRVDLYEIDNKVYFGELTFSPACCAFPNFSNAFDKEMGKKLTIRK